MLQCYEYKAACHSLYYWQFTWKISLLSLLLSCEYSFPVVVWIYLPSIPLHWNLPTKFSCGTRGTDVVHAPVPHKNYLCRYYYSGCYHSPNKESSLTAKRGRVLYHNLLSQYIWECSFDSQREFRIFHVETL